MNWKWLGSLCIVALACFGVNLKQEASPNQEIELQFQTNWVTSSEAQQAISHIKEKLQSIGIRDIQVAAVPGDPIKISYYSNVDVSLVKGLFTSEENLTLDYSSPLKESTPSNLPFSNGEVPYQLLITEISKESPNHLGFNGILVELKSIRDHYVNHIDYGCVFYSEFSVKKWIEKKSKNLHNSSVVLIENTSYKIPEVRAGPFA